MPQNDGFGIFRCTARTEFKEKFPEANDEMLLYLNHVATQARLVGQVEGKEQATGIKITSTESRHQIMLAMVVHKLAPEGLILTENDVEAFSHSERKAIVVHSMTDSIHFRLLTQAEAERLAEVAE